VAFRCEVCNTAQTAGTQPTKLVTETRRKEYLQGGGSSIGTEIVKELDVCDPCAAEIQSSAA
jgi:hypothetical protein